MRVQSQWDQAVGVVESEEILRNLALRHARLGGREGRRIAALIQRKAYRDLCEYKLDHSKEWNVANLIHCRQSLAFFQKLEWLDIGVDKELAAFSKFVQSEVTCLETNIIFRLWRSGALSMPPDVVRVLYAAQRKIAQVLGDVPSFEGLRFRFGPGASTTVKRRDSNPQRKLSAGVACSTNLANFSMLPSILREFPHWTSQFSSWSICDEGWLCERVPVIVTNGALQFVPKNAKTYRSIVIEPSLNSVVQLGIGDYIADRLRGQGVDIRDQTRNSSLARHGSLTGECVTLDLSSASDTIATELVKFLLPDAWFALLNGVRTTEVDYKGKTYRLEKFSSMGNGFTFPLETLIFWALSFASTRLSSGRLDMLSTYGDDIIVSTESYPLTSKVLFHAGFTINWAKSFVDGPFRESCGHDYYKGFDVRPYYQKDLISGRSLFVLHNFYFRHYDGDGCQQVLGFIPESLHLFGPDGYGDGHLLRDDWHRHRKSEWLKKGFEGSSFETFSLRPNRVPSRFAGDWITPLYQKYVSGEREFYSAIRLPPECNLQGIRVSPEPALFRKGRWYLTVPGTNGYTKSSIYTLGK